MWPTSTRSPGTSGAGAAPGDEKQYVTVFDASAMQQEKIYVSAGRIGLQVCCAPAELIRAARASTAALTHREGMKILDGS